MATIIATGGAGFLGSHVVDLLRKHGHDVFVPRSKDLDLRKMSDVSAMYGTVQPDIVVHMAAKCGGIGANQEQPGSFFYDNMLMGMNMIERARQYGLKKFVQLGTVCSYPKFTPVPFKEKDIWNGYPEETNAPYGVAKKSLLVMGQAYRQQYGLNLIHLIPVNLYGPRDNFDPKTSHVIPALINKCVAAKRNGDPFIEIWGSGNASREFLYVEDCARAIVMATERYNGVEPVNIGSGKEIEIRDLVNKIKKAVGYEGDSVYLRSKPDGQPRRCLDTTRALDSFGFQSETPFEVGLNKTVEWFLANTDLNKQL